MEETEELPSPWWPTKSKASPYNSKLEGDGDGGDGGVQLCGGGWPHLGGQAEAVEQPRAYDKQDVKMC